MEPSKSGKKRNRVQANSEPKTHNKSGRTGLAVSSISNEDLNLYYQEIQTQALKADEVIPGSPCLLLPAKDGRFSKSNPSTGKSDKIAYGYQIVARYKYGADIISEVLASKTGRDYVISHLCGTRNCVCPSHILVEDKWINDERTKCHFLLHHLAKNFGDLYEAVLMAGCPHEIECCTEHPEKLIIEQRDRPEDQPIYVILE